MTDLFEVIVKREYDAFIIESCIFANEKERLSILNTLCQLRKPCVTVNANQIALPVMDHQDNERLYYAAIAMYH